jgi:ferredoxin-NAD(P)+ reductase (naphthalene dioxygenase ferredoxin-specific)
MMGFRVTIANTITTIDCAPDQSILHAAIGAGVDYPYGCATGNCGACLSDLRSGEVTMLPYSDNALTAAQKADGKVLACRARPGSDVELLWLGRGRK